MDYRVDGAAIKRLRTERLLTQQKLAELADLSVMQISRIERNLQRPHFASINSIANALQVDASEFVEITDSTPAVCR